MLSLGRGSGNGAAGRAGEMCFIVLTIALTWLGNEFSASGGISPWFQKTSFGVPLNFILFFLILAVLLPYVLNTPRIAMTERLTALGLFWIVALVWTVIGLAIIVAIARGVPELFAD